MKSNGLLSTILLLSMTQGYSVTWTQGGMGNFNWEDNGNWSAAYPNAIDAIATFGNAPSGNTTVNDVGGGRETVGYIYFEPTSVVYTIGDPQSEYTINMQTSSGNALIQVQSGAQNVLFNADFGMLSNLDFEVASGLTLIETAVDNGAGGVSLFGVNIGVNNSTGTVEYQSSDGNQYSGPTTVLGGTLRLNKPSGSISAFAFKGDLLIQGGTVQHMQNTQHILTSNVFIEGGAWDLAGFTEEIASLAFTSGTFTGGGNLTLSSGGTALSMMDTSLDVDLILTGGNGTIVEFDAANNGTATFAGTLNMGGAVNGINYNIGSGTADIDMTISAVISNGAFLKGGAGTLELTGANTFSDDLVVNAGTLLIGSTGSLADQIITVALGATLGGTGIIGTSAATVNNSGTLAPGLSPGVLTINGNYTQTASGTLSVEILSLTSFDQLVVNNGSAILDGNLDLYLLPGHTFSGTETLILVDNAGGTGLMNTTFANINKFGFPPAATTEVSYTANTVLLSLFVPPTPDAPVNSTAFTAPVLSQTYQNTINFSRRLDRLRSNMQRRGGAAPLAVKASMSNNLIAATESPAMSAPDAAATARDFISQSTDSPTTPIRIDSERKNSWGVFADGVGSLGRVYKKSAQDPYRYYSAGGLIGFDYVGESFGIGFSPGYEYLHAKTLNHQNKFDIQTAEGTFFGTFMPCVNSNFFIDLIGGGAAQWYHFHRNTAGGAVNGKPLGYQWNVYSDIGYTASSCNWRFTPFLGLGYVQVHVPSYHETGPVLQTFHIGKQNIRSLRSSLGATGSYTIERGCFTFIPEVNILWQREFLNHNQNIAFASAPLAVASQMQAVGLGRNNFFAGGMLRFLFDYEIEVDASYDYEWNNRFHSHLLYLGLEKRF